MKWAVCLVGIFCTIAYLGHGQTTPCSIVVAKERSSDETVSKELVDLCYLGEARSADIIMLKTEVKYGIKYIIGELDDDLPMVIYKSFVVFFSEDKAFLLDLSFVEILHKEDSGGFYLGGIFQFRGFGNYYLYHVEHGKANLIFKSNEPIYSNSLGCSTFKTGKLQTFFEDLNNDGFKDLSFKGTRLIYCDDPETYRDDGKVVREEDVSIEYLFDPVEKKFRRY